MQHPRLFLVYHLTRKQQVGKTSSAPCDAEIVTRKGNTVMRKANGNITIQKRLEELRMNEHDRQRAIFAIRDAEAIVDGVVWIKEKIASLGALVTKPGL